VLIQETASRAVNDADEEACVHLIQGAIRQFARNPELWRDQVFFPCLAVLEQAGVYYWIDRSWHEAGEKSLFSNLTGEQSQTVLDAMLGADRIDDQAEQILKSIASQHHQMVLDWFGQRIEHAVHKSPMDFDPIPFSFQSLHEALQPYPRDVITSVRQWSDLEDGKGAWHASHFLSRVYPNFEEPLPTTISDMLKDADTDDLAFIAASLQGYDGRTDLLPLLRSILASDVANDEIERHVSSVFNETGTMIGEFGAAEAYQAKIDTLNPWLDDENKRVAGFASREIQSLKLQVASETRRAQEDIAMRKLQYGEDLNDGVEEAG
jgi:hypothetical protein